MGYTYKAMQDSITSICKSMLPFSSFNKPSLSAASELKLSKQQSDNLKWQQNSFHQILNLIGLHKHGLLPVCEVHAFRAHLLDTLIASKAPQLEQPAILRDKLLFLQELLYAKCISEEEYHSSKRPLLQRLAVQGVELAASDVIIGTHNYKDTSHEVWSTIDLKDDQSLPKKSNSASNNILKNGTSSAIKHIKNTASVLGFGSFHKLGKNRQLSSIFDHQRPFSNDHGNENNREIKSVILSEQTGKGFQGKDRGKKKPLQDVTTKGGSDTIRGDNNPKGGSHKWGLDGFKRWKGAHLEAEITAAPPPSHNAIDCTHLKDSYKLIANHDAPPPSNFIIDKVLGDKIKKELMRIQTQLSSANPNFEFSDDQMDAICTKLPTGKSDLAYLFPKSWCKQYGDLLLDVVKKEYKKHVEENENLRNATMERRHTSSKRWTTFLDDDQNWHPNMFAAQNNKTTAFCPQNEITYM